MNKYFILSVLFLVFSCKKKKENSNSLKKKKTNVMDSTRRDSIKKADKDTIELSLANAEKLVKLPLECIQNEYPNKLDHVINSKADLQRPRDLHPAFYGCFDWHSSVHSHWSLVRLLKKKPDLKEADQIKEKLLKDISKRNIQGEVAYFKKDANKGSERTYGWAWLLKLAEEIHSWDDPIAQSLAENLQPLTALMVDNFNDFLPKLTEPLRVGQHSNTAFAMVFAYDYAETVEDKDLMSLIELWAKRFYLHDENCPIAYEPGGFSFLSPCLEEADIMERVLAEEDFEIWLKKFLPQLYETDFDLKPGKVKDRSDGKLVHLDGLNFSRAWVFYDLANKYEDLQHLRAQGNTHLHYSFRNIIEGDSYMGSHWLGTFALYALERQQIDKK